AAGQRPLGRTLNDRAVGDRVGEWHSQLDHVGARAIDSPHDLPGRLEVGIARRHEGDEARDSAGAKICERLTDAAHDAEPPSSLSLRTDSTSLSPRPEMFTSTA